MQKLKKRHIKLITLFTITGIVFVLVKSIYGIYLVSENAKSPFIPVYLIKFSKFPHYVIIGVSVIILLTLRLLYLKKNTSMIAN